MSEALRVAVRVRPFIHEYEKADGIRNIIRMDKKTQQTFIKHPETGVEKAFTFDFSYDSFVGPEDPNHADQDTVWNDLGMDVLNNAWKGFNISLFAYGQTGAGKSHSMLGYPGSEGVVPRACREIFKRIDDNTDSATTFKVEASMLEIYNEKIRDLFNPLEGKSLKVRDNPKTGPYVQSLTKHAVNNYDELSSAMDAGTRARTVAATAMNATSSRAHTIFQVILTQTTVDKDAGRATDKVSTISLIDLAGSERADRTGAKGDRLKEGCAINQSLSALGNVIYALADKATDTKKKNVVVPYRDSVLTHLLKNSLGGNAKTVMIAAISPSCVNYDETLSTLRYADRAKQIKNKAVVNEDPNQKLIRGLKEEIEELKRMLMSGEMPAGGQQQGMEEAMKENQRLLRESERTWEDKLKDSRNQFQEHSAAFAKMGGVADDERMSTTAHIINLNQDPQMSGVLVHFFEGGLTKIGRKDAEEPQNIELSGLSINKQHAVVSTIGNKTTLKPCEGAKCVVNGLPITTEVELQHTNRLVFGNNHVFLCIIPNQSASPIDKEGRAKLLATHSWEVAMQELNAAELTNLTEGERKAREKAEREAKEMQEKVAALEARMVEERKAAEEAARAATDAEREKMRIKQKDMERALQEQIDQTNKKQAKKEKERRKKALVEEKILRTLPMVSEANAISQELEKRMLFEIKLVATQTAADEEDQGDATAFNLKTDVWICVQLEDDDIPRMWEYEKFVNRLYLMREMYEDFVDSNRNMDEINEIYGEDCDPFYDPPEDQLIGKAYIMLAPLGFLINIDDTAPIIDYHGKTNGALQVSFTLDEEQLESFENYDTDDELTFANILGQELKINVTVLCAKGLPKNLCNNVTVSYKFYTHTHRTPGCETQTINPRLDHVDKFTIPITEEFHKYVQKVPMEFQIWGNTVSEEDRKKMVDQKKRAKSIVPPAEEDDRGDGEEKTEPVEEAKVADTQDNESKQQHEKEEKEQEIIKQLEEEYKIKLEKLESESKSNLQAKESLESTLAEMKRKLAEKDDKINELEMKTKVLEGSVEMAKAAASDGNNDSKACIIS